MLSSKALRPFKKEIPDVWHYVLIGYDIIFQTEALFEVKKIT